MKIPKSIIEKAIEGGWELINIPELYQAQKWLCIIVSESIAKRYPSAIVLDPTFWQALGNSLGWPLKSKAWHCTYSEATWVVKAKEFYDLILIGQNTDVFWEKLLTNK